MKPNDLRIKEEVAEGVFIENLTEEYISGKEEFLMLLEEAESYRVVSESLLNINSSRSHVLFMLDVTQKLPEGIEKKGRLNIVDLAGNEKVSKSGAIGESLEEAKRINLSLSTLGKVINFLTSDKITEFVPYRESKLTRILQDISVW